MTDFVISESIYCFPFQGNYEMNYPVCTVWMSVVGKYMARNDSYMAVAHKKKYRRQ